VSRRPTCRIPSCRDGAVYAASSAPWRVYCFLHAVRLLGRVGEGVRLRPLEAEPPRCEHPEHPVERPRPATVLVVWGPRVGRRRIPPLPTLRCPEHGRELVAQLAAEPSLRVRRLPLGWTAEPDRSRLPTWRERRRMAGRAESDAA